MKPNQTLPISGVFTQAEWARILGHSPAKFEASLSKTTIRTIHVGEKILIDAAWFWSDLIEPAKGGTQ